MRVDRLIYVFDGAVHEDEPSDKLDASALQNRPQSKLATGACCCRLERITLVATRYAVLIELLCVVRDRSSAVRG